jgi:hypothetical protein
MNKFLIDAGSNYLRMLTIIVCSAPALTYLDFAFVAHTMTFAMLIVAAEKSTAAEIERASAYLKQSGVTSLGGL